MHRVGIAARPSATSLSTSLCLCSDKQMKDFDGETPYTIMFGPDICGFSTKKVHTILNHNGENHLIKKEIDCKTDETTHVYTLVLKPDNTYEVRRQHKNMKHCARAKG
jgi:hypothetical protein